MARRAAAVLAWIEGAGSLRVEAILGRVLRPLALTVCVTGVLLRLVGINAGSLIVMGVIVLSLSPFIDRMIAPPDHLTVKRLVALVLLLHIPAAIVLYWASVLTGHGGFYTGDDFSYSQAGEIVSNYLRGIGDPNLGPPIWGGYAYILGTYAYFVTAAYLLLGPDVLAVGIMNAGLFAAAMVLLFDLTRRIVPDRRAAILTTILSAVYPSLVVWSGLNLKESLTLLLMMAALLCLRRFQERPGVLPLLSLLVLLFTMEGLRRWVYLLVAGAAVAGVAMTPHLRRLPRLRWSALAFVLIAGLAQYQTLSIFVPNRPDLLLTFAQIRLAMATGARTSYGGATPIPMVAEPGARFVVVTPAPTPVNTSPEPTAASTTSNASAAPLPTAAFSAAPVTAPPPPRPTTPATASGTAPTTASPGATAAGTARTTASPGATAAGSPAPRPTATAAPPTPEPTTIVVAPGTRLVLAPTSRPDGSLPSPTPEPATVLVRPGDTVVVTDLAQPETTSASGTGSRLMIAPDQGTTISTTSANTLNLLAHAPEGLMYALFAPFPWSIERPLDVALVLEMLLWYGILVAAVRSLWIERTSWRLFGPTLLFVLGALAVFALVEGNVGTLFRHRAMLIPPTILLAAPTLAGLARRALGPRSGEPLVEHAAEPDTKTTR